jgi:DNA polymerase-3 subunit gamma/tau
LAQKSTAQNGDKLTFGIDPVSPDELMAGWNDFVNKLKLDGRDREYNTLNQRVNIDQDLCIHLMLPNSFQTKTIEDVQQELLTYLRTRFNNGKIKLLAEVEKFEEKKLIYTNNEKFEYLAEKYPELKKLKQRLDLDTDF